MSSNYRNLKPFLTPFFHSHTNSSCVWTISFFPNAIFRLRSIFHSLNTWNTKRNPFHITQQSHQSSINAASVKWFLWCGVSWEKYYVRNRNWNRRFTFIVLPSFVLETPSVHNCVCNEHLTKWCAEKIEMLILRKIFNIPNEIMLSNRVFFFTISFEELMIILILCQLIAF